MIVLITGATSGFGKSCAELFFKPILFPKSINKIIDGFLSDVLTSALIIVPTLISTSKNCLYSIILISLFF